MEGPSKKRKVHNPILKAMDKAKVDKVPFVRLLAAPGSYQFEEKLVRVDHQALQLGRSNQAATNNGSFDCLQLSAHHATIVYNSGGFTIRDENSKNGCYLNEKRLGAVPVPLFCGDKVQLGVRGYTKDTQTLRLPIICFINVFDSNGTAIFRPTEKEEIDYTEEIDPIVDTESLVIVDSEDTQDPSEIFEKLQNQPDAFNEAERKRLTEAKRIFDSGQGACNQACWGSGQHHITLPVSTTTARTKVHNSLLLETLLL